MGPDDFYYQLKRQLEQTISGAETISDEVWPYMRTAITNVCAKLEVVTREEFDTQCAVLKRSREKIDALESQLEALRKVSQDI